MAAQQAFIDTYGPLAQDIATKTGLDPTVVLGQIAQETGWGQHVQGNNIFGISPKGQVANYPSVQAAAQDYIALMKGRYASAAAAPTPAAQAQAIASGGYNEDPTYGTKVAQIAATLPAPAAGYDVAPAFSARWGLPAAANTNAPTPVATPPAADFNTRWGLPAAPAAPSEFQTVPTHDVAGQEGASTNLSDADLAKLRADRAMQTPAAVATPVAAAAAPAPQPASQPDTTTWDTAPSPGYGQWDAAHGTLLPANNIPTNPLSYQSVSGTLAPAPNTTYGEYVPLARDNTTGTLRLAMPMAARNLLQGGADLLNGPASGSVTPQATATLGAMTGQLTPSPAAGTYAAIRSAAQARAANPLQPPVGSIGSPAVKFVPPAPHPAPPPQYLPPEFRAQPGVMTPQVPMNAGGLTEPVPYVAPAFVPPGSHAPGRVPERPLFVPPEAPAPPSGPSRVASPATEATNPLQAPQEPLPSPNPLQAPTTPPVALNPTSGMTPREAAEYNAIPETLPSAPLLPPASKAAADARADRLIQHFSTRKGEGAQSDLVPGYEPTLAQKTNDPGLATLERGVQSVNPGPFAMRAENNQKAIQDFVHKLIGTQPDTEAAEAQIDAEMAPRKDAVFANPGKADLAPVAKTIDDILAGPDGKRGAVKKTLGSVTESLYDADGKLETDPSMLWGIRKNINDLLMPAAQRENPELQAASRQLIEVKNVLDEAIEPAAPGFTALMSDYANRLRPVDEMKYLQKLNLTDATGNVRLQAVDSAIKNIQKQQQLPGVQKATSVSTDTLAALNTLRNTLRTQAASAAGKPINSTTFQNLATNSAVGNLTGNPLVSAGLGGLGAIATGGPVGAIVAPLANMGIHRIMGNAERNVSSSLIERLLNLQGKGDAVFQQRPRP